MGQRHMKHLVNLARFGDRVEGCRHPTQNRGDSEPGHGFMRGQGAEDLDSRGRQADLLVRLAQGGGGYIGIALVLLAAGKGDLAGMMLQPRGALGQDDFQPVASHDEGYQHARGPEFAPGRKNGVGVEIEIGRRPAGFRQGRAQGDEGIRFHRSRSLPPRIRPISGRDRNAHRRTGNRR